MKSGVDTHILRILARLEGILPERDIGNSRSMAEHGEPIIAIELMCTQLYEFECSITPEIFSEVEKVALDYAMPPSGWNYIRELVDEVAR